ncbi:MAG: NAD-binding protein, partial [Fibrobacterales bacterium]|nr:NAD-binding protein [Fibrobacterales bacterium]
FVVADSNRTVVEQLREQGVHAVTGNVSEAGTLVQAHIAQAGALVVTATDAVDLHRIVEVARILRPEVKILVRSTSAEEADRIEAEGLGRVFLEEEEISAAMCREVGALLKGGSSKDMGRK